MLSVVLAVPSPIVTVAIRPTNYPGLWDSIFVFSSPDRRQMEKGPKDQPFAKNCRLLKP